MEAASFPPVPPRLGFSFRLTKGYLLQKQEEFQRQCSCNHTYFKNTCNDTLTGNFQNLSGARNCVSVILNSQQNFRKVSFIKNDIEFYNFYS